ncbi:hypothetical protein ACFWYW_41830 [Nonomuraea sp. NPDC059023]|uniref:hypothetical protein n=1 Tax=unclassified Nonomuraea TaxID=2593643 RepID=UPI0036A67B75
MNDVEMTELLLDIADAGEHGIADRLRRENPCHVARAALEELTFRLNPATVTEPAVDVQFLLSAGDRSVEFALRVGAAGIQVTEGKAPQQSVTIRWELRDLVLALYGRPGAACDATRVVSVDGEPGPRTNAPDDPWLLRYKAAGRVAGEVLNALSPVAPSVRHEALKAGADKWGENWFAAHYDRHFAKYRDRRVNVLEIGIGGFEAPDEGGESLRMWKSYFRRGIIHGLDIFDKSPLAQPRVRIHRADQSDPLSLREVADQIDGIDLIIDDGSHISSHTITAFHTLFPLLKDGGLYVVEDVQTSYWPGWNGGHTSFTHTATWIGFLKKLIDGLHHQDQLDEESRLGSYLDRSVTAIHIYHNLVFIEKGVNGESTAPSWVRRHTNDMELTPRGSMVKPVLDR